MSYGESTAQRSAVYCEDVCLYLIRAGETPSAPRERLCSLLLALMWFEGSCRVEATHWHILEVSLPY